MPVESRRSFAPESCRLSGDLGIIDGHGYVRIVGRRREPILRGGYQIRPREVTDPLRAYPVVNDVCVTGIPHDSLGELVCARIVRVSDPVRVSDVFPMTGSGRVKQRELECEHALDHTPS